MLIGLDSSSFKDVCGKPGQAACIAIERLASLARMDLYWYMMEDTQEAIRTNVAKTYFDAGEVNIDDVKIILHRF